MNGRRNHIIWNIISLINNVACYTLLDARLNSYHKMERTIFGPTQVSLWENFNKIYHILFFFFFFFTCPHKMGWGIRTKWPPLYKAWFTADWVTFWGQIYRILSILLWDFLLKLQINITTRRIRIFYNHLFEFKRFFFFLTYLHKKERENSN